MTDILLKLKKTAQRLVPQNINLYLVGGAVRDQLLGLPVRDIDVVITGVWPYQVCWDDYGFTLTEEAHGKDFPSWTLRSSCGAVIDLALPRNMKDKALIAHPCFTIHQDVQFRDFTVNSIAKNLATGDMIHPDGAMNDLRDHSIVPNAGSLIADPVRAIRALRFAARLGFGLSDLAQGGISTVRNQLRTVHPNRIALDMNKALMLDDGAKVAKFLDSLRVHNLLDVILPELLPMIGQTQNTYHTMDVWDHTMAVVAHTPPDLTLRWAALLHDVAKPATAVLKDDGINYSFIGHEDAGADMIPAIMNRFRSDNLDSAIVADVVALVRNHLTPAIGATPRTLRRLLNRLDGRVDLLNKFIDLKAADTAGGKNSPQTVEAVLAVRDTFPALLAVPTHSLSHLAINGNDLLALGMSGPAIGKVLNGLLAAVMDDPDLNDKDTLLAMVWYDKVQYQGHRPG